MLSNIIGGLQGIIDHVMVGHFVGYRANAAIGVSWQIVLVIIVFAMSVFTGMGVLVSRFAGANEPDKVNKVVYQAFLTAAGMSVLLGTVGWRFAAPGLLRLVNAAPEVQAEALPFPAHDARGHPRHDDFLHAEPGRRFARPATRGRRLRGWAVLDDGPHDRPQPDVDSRLRHDWRRVRHPSRRQQALSPSSACGACGCPTRAFTSSRA